MHVEDTKETGAILRMPDVIKLTGFKRSTIYNMMNPRSPRYDASFPQRITLGPNSVGWRKQEIEKWIASRPVKENARLKQSPLKPALEEVENLRTVPKVSLAKVPETSTHEKAIETDVLKQKRIETIRKILEGDAKKGMIIGYSEIMQRLMLEDKPEDYDEIDRLLAHVSGLSYAENQILLSSLVRERSDPDALPRKNFFVAAEALGLTIDNPLKFVQQQFRNVLAQYKDPAYRTQEIRWVEVRRKCYAVLLTK